MCNSAIKHVVECDQEPKNQFNIANAPNKRL